MALKLLSKPEDCLTYQITATVNIPQGKIEAHSAKSGFAFAIDGGLKGRTVVFVLNAPYVEAIVATGQSIAPGDDVFVHDTDGLARKTDTAGYSKVGYCINSFDKTSNEGEAVTIRWVSDRE